MLCLSACICARVRLHLADPDATKQTRALYSQLWALQQRGFMFGHHDDLAYGRYWRDLPGNSDTKAVSGDYPAVCSMDFGSMMDDRYDPQSQWAATTRRLIQQARRRGEVITCCAHLGNPLTGGDSWDNSSHDVLREILTDGSTTHQKYLLWLDRLAQYARTLIDDRGEPIPILFRPFHEHTQTWNWWGRGCASEEQFVALWRFTVDYLRKAGIHHFIYVISPQSHGRDDASRFTFWWPGDDYVDVMGYDYYEGETPDVLRANLQTLSRVAAEKRKPCAVTEAGLEAFKNPHYWTQQILEPATSEGVRLSFIVFWRNKYVENNEKDTHYFSVFPGHPSEEDFRQFYQSPRTFFSNDLPPMYRRAKGIRVR